MKEELIEQVKDYIATELNKKRKKTFTSNQDYFKWYNDNKDKINILEFKITEDKIKLSYEERVEEDE